ncbi:fumarylacetoacetate hydrolase family protein [Fusarium austroafricanum]|uniref:Fumarylacetoacetate hydrolase family protein n=1 Tax=Fusarium austroafricanum TaxID=2364996 RepID=A0A8H4P2F5_9HYPO|nr:fumarylacetoacetate hydrolase family protein [Fusarium austroafricanum]
MSAFTRLVRFVEGDATFYGDFLDTQDGRYTIQKLHGSPFTKLEDSGKVVTTDTLAAPKYPAVFNKPADALAGPFDDVKVHPEARSMLDWEGELAFVVGKDAKNVSEEDAMDYILGYTASNDVSARNFQIPEVCGWQFGYAKSFDGFAPIGHTIVSAKAVSNPLEARITTKVNGVIKQDSNTSDLIFGAGKILSHLSRGTTIRAGTVVMTGTPSGVRWSREPKEFLKDGDVVEIEVEGVGMIRNTIRFHE